MEVIHGVLVLLLKRLELDTTGVACPQAFAAAATVPVPAGRIRPVPLAYPTVCVQADHFGQN
jgi:hypothetical protein